MGYLRGVEKAGAFGAGEDVVGHAVGDAGDEFRDFVAAGQGGQVGTEDQFCCKAAFGDCVAFCEQPGDGVSPNGGADGDGEVGQWVDAG